jgi:hypothetical protein
MRKNEVKAKLELLANLAEIGEKLKEEITERVTAGMKEDITQMLDDVKEGRKDADACMKELTSMGYLDKAEEGEPVQTPYIKYEHLGSLELGVTYPDGDKLAAYLSEVDYGTYQTGSMYWYRGGSPMDLTMAEMKKGDLAKVNGLTADNKDIDVMVWGNPYEEDFTYKTTLRHEEMENAFESDMESEQEERE